MIEKTMGRGRGDGMVGVRVYGRDLRVWC